jgi:hypothetical protein
LVVQIGVIERPVRDFESGFICRSLSNATDLVLLRSLPLTRFQLSR